MSEAVAGVCAGVAALGWAGWYVAFGFVGDPPTRGGLIGLVVSALVVASLGWLLGVRTTRPLKLTAVRIGRGLGVIRGDTVAPATALRRELAIAKRVAPSETGDLLATIERAMVIVEERQNRETAWLAATIHDQRAPLIGWANLLATSSSGRGVSGSSLDLEGIAHDLRAQAATFQRILEVVRLERADVAMRRADEDLRALVERVVGRAPSRPGVEVCVEGVGYAYVDAGLVERAVGNLVENSLRFARTRVDVVVFSNLVRVKDDGPGLNGTLDVLTEPFRATPPTGGLPVPAGAAGIGLSVVRRILELHGGRLAVEASDGSGTTLLAYLGARQRDA